MKKLILNHFKRVISVILTAMFLLSTVSFEVFAASPKVSIIIPVYNTPENLLRDCLNSAKNQTLKDIEIICVDDGSTNGSGKILDEYAKTDPRFVVVHQKNGGVSTARNKGMDLAKGEYIKFLDSDDMIDPITAEKSYNVAKEHDADIVRYSIKPIERGAHGWASKRNYKKLQIINCSAYDSRKVGLAWGGLYKNKFLKDNKITFCQCVYKSEDALFGILCSFKSHKVLCMPDRLYTYRNNCASISTTSKGPWFLQTSLHGIEYLYKNLKNSGHLNDTNAKIDFLSIILKSRFFEHARSNGRLFISQISKDPELLQDDVINKLPVKEKIQLKSIIQRSNLQTKTEKIIDDGIYTISSKLNPNMRLDIHDSSKNDKANLQLWQKNGSDAQKFKIQYNSDGCYTITAMCSGKSIDVASAGEKNGTNVWQYNSNGTDAQKWFIVPDGEGYYCLVSKCNNLCMDDSSVKAKNGANIHCWTIHGGDNQRFKLEKCEDKSAEVKKDDVKSNSNKSAEVKENTVKPSANKPAETKKDAVKPSSNKPAETKKDTVKPSANKPAEIKKDAVKPSSNKPAEVKKDAIKPSSNKPTEVKKDDGKPNANKPAKIKKSA